jgi:hypothetical protein
MDSPDEPRAGIGVGAENRDADTADRYQADERTWMLSLLLGSLVAALLGSSGLTAFSPIAPIGSGGVERLGVTLVLFVLIACAPLPLVLLVQSAIDVRMRRTTMPFGFLALVRGASLAVLGGVLFGVFGLVSGRTAVLADLAGAGAASGLWIGAVGAILGSALERSRAVRLVAAAVVLVAIVAGLVVFAVWIGGR